MSDKLDYVLDVYLNEVRKQKSLSKEEEYSLFKDYKENNNLNAMNKLITSHLRFVIYVAKSFKNYNVDFMDLIQEGNYALLGCIKKYNPDEFPDGRFVTYASYEIRYRLRNFVNKFKSMITFSTTHEKRALVHNAKDIVIDFSEENINSIIERYNVKKSDVIAFFNYSRSTFSDIDEYIDYHYAEDSIFDEIYEEQKNKLLKNAINKLSPRYKKIITGRHLSEPRVDLKALAEEDNCSPQRIEQIEKLSLQKLREELDMII